MYGSYRIAYDTFLEKDSIQPLYNQMYFGYNNVITEPQNK